MLCNGNYHLADYSVMLPHFKFSLVAIKIADPLMPADSFQKVCLVHPIKIKKRQDT